MADNTYTLPPPDAWNAYWLTPYYCEATVRRLLAERDETIALLRGEIVEYRAAALKAIEAEQVLRTEAEALRASGLDDIEILRLNAARFLAVLRWLSGTKRADFFEPLRQIFYDTDDKYPDAEAITDAIDAARAAGE